MKKLYVCFLILLICVASAVNAGAFSAKQHDQYLEKVLFGENGYSGDKKDVIDSIEKASYLTIDYVSSPNGDAYLKTLKNYGVKSIPRNCKAFTIENAFKGNHRKYTHMGWEYDYGEKQDQWDIRKNILLATVNWSFDFGLFSSKLFGYDVRCEAFAAYVYYIHMAGDCVYNEGEEDKTMLTIGDINEDTNVIDELYKYAKVLFEDQKQTRVFTNYLNALEKLNRKWERLIFNPDKLTEEELIEARAEFPIELMDCLIEHVPKLLMKEEFFAKVFYPDLVK